MLSQPLLWVVALYHSRVLDAVIPQRRVSTGVVDGMSLSAQSLMGWAMQEPSAGMCP